MLRKGSLNKYGKSDFMKKKLFLLFIPFLLVGCRPVLEGSSSLSSSDIPSGDTSSEDSEGDGGTTEGTGDTDPSGDPSPDTSTSVEPEECNHTSFIYGHDETDHWKICSDCGQTFDREHHIFEEPEIIEPATHTEKGTKRSTCHDCGFYIDEDIPIITYTVEEKCDELNASIPTGLFDAFELKEFVNSQGVPTEVAVDENKYIGYDESKNKLVVYQNDAITYPLDCVGDDLFTFKSHEVTTFAELKTEVLQVGGGSVKYSSIKLANNIDIPTDQNTLNISGVYPIEINLNNHTLKTDDPSKDVVTIEDNNVVILIKNGTIQTGSSSANNKSPRAIYAKQAQSVRLQGLHIECGAERGYGYLDSLYNSSKFTTKISKCTFESETFAIVTQSNNYVIEKSTIRGNININGGNVVIDSCNVSAKGMFKDNDFIISGSKKDPEFIDSEYLSNVLKLYYKDNVGTYGTAILTGPDAILVVDRRSVYSLYPSPAVTVKKCTLEADEYENTVLGYGFRYIDLAADPNKSSNISNVVLGTGSDVNVFSGVSGEPQNAQGGYNYYQ